MSSARKKMHLGKVQFCRKTPSVSSGCFQTRVRMLTGWDVCAQDVSNESVAAKYRASSHKGLSGTLGSSQVRSSGHSSRERWRADGGCQLRRLKKKEFCRLLGARVTCFRHLHRVRVKMTEYWWHMLKMLVITQTVEGASKQPGDDVTNTCALRVVWYLVLLLT